MNPVQIAYFKHFLYDKGIQKHFINNFYEFHAKNSIGGSANPDSLEEYLQLIALEDFVMKAFCFFISKKPKWNHWKEISDMWIAYWDIHKDNPINRYYPRLTGTFKILRTNWDKENFYDEENTEQTLQRMHIMAEEVAAVGSRPHHETTIAPTVQEQEEPAKNENAESADEVSDLLDGFQLVHTNNYTYQQLKDMTASVNLGNGSFKITFAKDLSKQLRDGKYKHANYLVKGETKEIALLFSRDLQPNNGCKLNIPEKVANVYINSVDMLNKIQKFYKTEQLYFLMDITSVTRINDKLVYILKKQ